MKTISKTAHDLLGHFLGNTEATKHLYSDGSKIMATNGPAIAYICTDDFRAGFYDLAVSGEKYTFTPAQHNGMFPAFDYAPDLGNKIKEMKFKKGSNLKLKLRNVGLAIPDQVIDAIADSDHDYIVYFSDNQHPAAFQSSEITIIVLPETYAATLQQ